MITIFGSNGMLGRYVHTYAIQQGLTVRSVTRNDFDASNFQEYSKLESIIKDSSLIVNCIGSIKPIVDSQSTENTFMVNSIFPNYLGNISSKSGIDLVHVTTDCVFTGNSQSPYNEDSFKDSLDAYGFSKSIGDHCYGTVIRCSIIGEEVFNKRSLLEWAIGMKGKTVSGFTNHLWNGVTCLELSKIIHSYEWKRFKGVLHLFSKEEISKYNLLRKISKAYNLNLDVQNIEAPNKCNRVLSGKLKFIQLDKSYDEQLADLANYSTVLYGEN